jgi:hypothetical protein
MQCSQGPRLFFKPDISRKGGGSPPIGGLKLSAYREIAGVKAELVDPKSLVFSDPPGDFNTFFSLSEVWERHLVRSIAGRDDFPLICPIAINTEGLIYDGNHRAAAAALHTNLVPVFMIDSQRNLDAIKKLDELGLYYWCHGFDIDKLKAGEVGAAYTELIEYLIDLSAMVHYDSWARENSPSVYFARNPLSPQSQVYLLARALKNMEFEACEAALKNQRYDDSDVFEHYEYLFISEPPVTLQKSLESGFLDGFRRLAKKAGQVFDYDPEVMEDAVQRVMGGLIAALP